MDALATLSYLKTFQGLVAGTDEAGRGPLAGPVMAAAVVLTPKQERFLLDRGLRDSKKMTHQKRESLFETLCELHVPWGAQAVGIDLIADINISKASLLAMGQSILKLRMPVDLVVVDGISRIPGLPFEQLPLVAADDLVPAVSAASVVAKVLRDRVMIALDRLYPQYGFAKHKGYPTEAHREAIRTFGLSPVHRVAFCKKLMVE